jgi:hypothetical protein
MHIRSQQNVPFEMFFTILKDNWKRSFCKSVRYANKDESRRCRLL